MRRRRHNEGGYALLLVFALAAAVAVKFYLEMPRVAFEHQRNKEGLLVERGEQFIRAIKLYYRKNQKWPQNLDDLEKSQETRYLRKRYKDPMTGEDEWRLVHIDGAGRYTDSLIKKQGEEEEKRPDVLAARVQGIGASAEILETGLDGASTNPALQRRASDRIIPGTPGVESSGEGGVQLQPGVVAGTAEAAQGNPPVAPPPAPGQAPVRGTLELGTAAQSPPGQTGSSTAGSFGMSSGFGFGSGAATSRPEGPTSPTTQPSPADAPRGPAMGGFSPVTGVPGPGGAAGQPNQALRLINQILTGPRQTGPGGALGQQGGQNVATGIGGLAGVASKKDMDGIMVYNEQTNYKKWEFVYDLKKEMEARGMMGGPGQTTSPNQGGPGQGQQRPATGSGFGSSFGTGMGSQGGPGQQPQMLGPRPGFGKQ